MAMDGFRFSLIHWVVLAAMTVAISTLANAAIDIRSNPIRPSVDVDINLSGTWSDACVPDRPAAVTYEKGEVQLWVGLFLNPDPTCSPSASPYEFNVSRLNVRADANIESGPILLTKRIESNVQETEAAHLELPPAISQFVYFVSVQGDVLVYRADSWEHVETISFLDSAGLISDQPGYVSYFGEIEALSGLETWTAVIAADFNLPMVVESNNPLVDILVVPGDEPLFRGHVYLARNERKRLHLPYGVSTTLPDFAGGLAYSNDYIFVTLPTMNAVLMVNRVDGIIHREIAVGDGPTLAHQSASANRVVISGAGNRSISLLDGTSGALLATMQPGSEVRQFAYSENADLFLAVLLDGRLAGLSASGGDPITPISFASPVVGVSVNRAANEIYVLLESDIGTNLEILDATTLSSRGSVKLPIVATSIAHYTSDSYWQSPAGQLRPVPVPTLGSGSIIALIVIFTLWVVGFLPRRRQPTGQSIQK